MLALYLTASKRVLVSLDLKADFNNEKSQIPHIDNKYAIKKAKSPAPAEAGAGLLLLNY